MFNITKQLKTAILFFGIAALLGTYLRAFPLLPHWATYKFILHTHSHIALIGWIYLFLSGLVVERYTNYKSSRSYKALYSTAVISILGMMLSFPFQGYAIWSIVFSTLFLFVSYFLVYWVIKYKNDFTSTKWSFTFIKSALYYLALSSIGPWALGLIMTLGGKETIWYQLSVYFYLHFQYNGWMLFGLFGLIYSIVEAKGIDISISKMKATYRLLHIGVLLSFFVNVLWTHPPLYVHLLTALGGGLLLWSLWHPYRMIRQLELKKVEQLLLIFIGFLLLLKSIGLIALGIPSLSDQLHQQKDLIIAFIHMNFIGIVSLALLWIAFRRTNFKIFNGAMILFLIGFLITELLMIIRSTHRFTMDYNAGLSLGSLCLALGIFWMGFQLKDSNKECQ